MPSQSFQNSQTLGQFFYPLYVPVVPADRDEIEPSAGTRSVITYPMRLWYRPTMLK